MNESVKKRFDAEGDIDPIPASSDVHLFKEASTAIPALSEEDPQNDIKR